MKSIPQYLRAEVQEDDGMSWGLPPKLVNVYIGDVVVYAHEADFYTEDEQAELDAMNAFGTMLKLKIGNANV